MSASFADLAGTPIEWLGVNALVREHQYLAISGAICAIAADLPDLQRRFEARYGSVAAMQTAELARVEGRTVGRASRA